MSQLKYSSEAQSATRSARLMTGLVMGVAMAVAAATVTPKVIEITQRAGRQQVPTVMPQIADTEPLIEQVQWRLLTMNESVWQVDIEVPKIEEPPKSEPEVKPEPVPEPPKPQPKPKPKPKPKPVVKPQPVPKPVEKPAPVTVAPTPPVAPVVGSTETAPPVDGSSGAPSMEQLVLDEIVAVIERRKKYPLRAQEMGIEGIVTVRVEVGADGIVRAYRLKSGGHYILRKATEDAARGLKGFKTRSSAAFTLDIPVRYQIQ